MDHPHDETDLPGPSETRTRDYAGRLGANVFIVGAIIVLATMWLLPAGVERGPVAAVAASALVIGLVFRRLPWARLPRAAALLPPATALGLIALGGYVAPGAARSYLIAYALVFVLVGLTLPPWTSLALAPVAIVSFVTAIDGRERAVLDMFVALPMAVLIGELLARVLARQARTEQALRGSELRFRKVFESGPVGMAMVDSDTRVVRANAALAAMLGYDERELGHHTLKQLTYPPDIERERPLIEGAFTGEIPRYEIEKRYVARSGRIVWAAQSSTVVRDEGGRAMYGLVVVEDVTRRKEAEEELMRRGGELAVVNDRLAEAVSVKDHVLAVTNHELRTPLTTVLGLAATLLRGWERIPDDDKRSYLDAIVAHTRSLADLIDDLMTVTGAEAGGLGVNISVTDLGGAIEAAMSHDGGDRAGVTIRCPDDLVVAADRRRLVQILTNYLDNAFKYGAPPVELEASEQDGWVIVRVRDSGEGVPPEFVPKLFDKFTQARANGDAGGSGLGLAIVKELARAQGGDAWYEPNRPRGACFCLRLRGRGQSLPA